MTNKHTYYLPTSESTEQFGKNLANACPQQCNIFLQGELGAGKTTLVRGFLKQLGVATPIKSPTYTLVESYQTLTHKIFHFDLYRLTNPEELEYIGFRDYLQEKAIILIEWPERAQNLLPLSDLTCYIELQQRGRKLELAATSEYGQKIITKIAT